MIQPVAARLPFMCIKLSQVLRFQTADKTARKFFDTRLFMKTKTSRTIEKFADEGELIYEFNEEFLVVCPKCSSMVRVFPAEIGSDKLNARLTAQRKLVCLSCPYRSERAGGAPEDIGGGRDCISGFRSGFQSNAAAEKRFGLIVKDI
jgi:hypothetical protein